MTHETKPVRLFTPGPLSTSKSVKHVMLEDVGSRDFKFIETVRSIRSKLLRLGNVSEQTHSVVLMQGSGSFGLESVISSAIVPTQKLFVISNGHYGQRLAQIAAIHNISTQICEFEETEIPNLKRIEQEILSANPTHVGIVHCETTTGVINPIEGVAEICRKHQKSLIVDAMSSFGGIPIDLAALPIDFLISSSNKCLQGVPGFSFIIARREALKVTEGRARSLVLDLHASWMGFEKDEQFRFTPATHTFLAFEQALKELDEEGGIAARERRYEDNHRRVLDGMQKLGFVPLLPRDMQGPIITSFRFPKSPHFDFKAFYSALNQRGLVIYPGKVSKAPCFRIGHIGDLFAQDMDALVEAISDVVVELGIRLDV